MAIREPSFTLGIEEEYLLVDKDSRDLASEPSPALLAKCQEALLDYGSQVSPEFLRSQIEVGTSVCHTIKEARDELVRLRSTVGAIADEFGLAPIASSTHLSPIGGASSTPTKSATTCWREICSRSRAGW